MYFQRNFYSLLRCEKSNPKVVVTLFKLSISIGFSVIILQPFSRYSILKWLLVNITQFCIDAMLSFKPEFVEFGEYCNGLIITTPTAIILLGGVK